jgi:hypothetical protein
VFTSIVVKYDSNICAIFAKCTFILAIRVWTPLTKKESLKMQLYLKISIKSTVYIE